MPGVCSHPAPIGTCSSRMAPDIFVPPRLVQPGGQRAPAEMTPDKRGWQDARGVVCRGPASCLRFCPWALASDCHYWTPFSNPSSTVPASGLRLCLLGT